MYFFLPPYQRDFFRFSASIFHRLLLRFALVHVLSSFVFLSCSLFSLTHSICICVHYDDEAQRRTCQRERKIYVHRITLSAFISHFPSRFSGLIRSSVVRTKISILFGRRIDTFCLTLAHSRRYVQGWKSRGLYEDHS